MARNWDRFQPRWKEHGWLTDDGNLPPEPRPAIEEQKEADSTEGKEAAPVDAAVAFWTTPAAPMAIEMKARKLLCWTGARESVSIRRSQERLLFLKSLTDPGKRDQQFWDKHVATFLKSSSPAPV